MATKILNSVRKIRCVSLLHWEEEIPVNVWYSPLQKGVEEIR